MELTMAGQTGIFLWSCLLGCGLGLLYDLFRITRVAFRLPRWAVLLEDLIFFTLCAAFNFLFLMEMGDGRMRWYVLAGEGLGALVYWATLGAVVMRVTTVLVQAVSRAVQRILRVLLRPVFWIWRQFCRLLRQMASWLRLGTVKMRNSMKYSLKTRMTLLYNKLYKHPFRKEP